MRNPAYSDLSLGQDIRTHAHRLLCPGKKFAEKEPGPSLRQKLKKLVARAPLISQYGHAVDQGARIWQRRQISITTQHANFGHPKAAGSGL
jgi:hypothetical protein